MADELLFFLSHALNLVERHTKIQGIEIVEIHCGIPKCGMVLRAAG
jgi:hypothetical protein